MARSARDAEGEGQFNPVMAAKYAALTGPPMPPRLTRGRGRPGRQQPRPRAARQDPRRVRRLLAALDLLHGRPPHQLGRRGRLREATDQLARRRQPDQRFHLPAPLQVPLTSLPDDEGESEPAWPSGINPPLTP